MPSALSITQLQQQQQLLHCKFSDVHFLTHYNFVSLISATSTFSLITILS